MIVNVYAVYDSKAQVYRAPQFIRSRGESLRSWQQVVNDSTTEFAKFPADFTLFEIGTFDDESGMLMPHVSKVSLGTALEFKKSDLNQMELFDNVKKITPSV